MIDKTTEGYTATPEEVEGMLRNLCAYALSEPDPLQRYLDLTHQQVVFDGVVAAIRRERGRALAEMMTMGAPVAKVAEVANLESPAKVKSLITSAGLAVPVHRPAARPRAAAVPRQRPAPKAEQPAPEAARPAPRTAPEAARPTPRTEPEAARPAPGTADRTAAAAPRAVEPAAPAGRPSRASVLPRTPDPVAKRTLTPAERAALGLPALGPIPQTFSRRESDPARSR